MEEKEKKKLSRRAAATAVAAVASAGVVVGGLFQSPEDLMDGQDDAPAPVAGSVLPDVAAGDGDGIDDDAVSGEDEEKRRSPRARARAWIRGLPWGVRALAGVPLWAAGWLIVSGLSGVWSAALPPVLGAVLGWLVTAALLLGAFILTVKAVFPDLPVKKIVNRRSLTALLAGTLLLGIAGSAAPLFWPGYTRVAALVRAVVTAGLLGGVTAFFLRRERARRAKKAAAAEPPRETLEEAQKRALRRAREMVDEAGRTD